MGMSSGVNIEGSGNVIDGSKLGMLPRVPEGITVTDPNVLAAQQILSDLQQGTGPVPERTIIRWTSVHPVNGAEFHYAAVFAGGGWYTTVAKDNDNVQKIMSHEALVTYLNRKKHNLRDIAVAVDFAKIVW